MKTAGIYIFNPEGRLLVVHPTEVFDDIWGIPKGMVEPFETVYDAAIREVYEETGIDISKYPSDRIKYVGSKPYKNKYKTLIAYTITLDDYIPVKNLKCKSLFKSLYTGDMIPEVDKFRWVYLHKFHKNIKPEQVELWKEYEKYSKR